MTFLKNERGRLAFQFGRASALRSTNETVDQLREQLEKVQQQLAFERHAHEQEIAILIRDLAQAKLELARRDVAVSFAAAPSPSEFKH
jgi:predicted phage tail protein